MIPYDTITRLFGRDFPWPPRLTGRQTTFRLSIIKVHGDILDHKSQAHTWQFQTLLYAEILTHMSSRVVRLRSPVPICPYCDLKNREDGLMGEGLPPIPIAHVPAHNLEVFLAVQQELYLLIFPFAVGALAIDVYGPRVPVACLLVSISSYLGYTALFLLRYCCTSVPPLITLQGEEQR